MREELEFLNDFEGNESFNSSPDIESHHIQQPIVNLNNSIENNIMTEVFEETSLNSRQISLDVWIYIN